AVAVLRRQAVQPGGDLADPARVVRRGLADRAEPGERASGAHPRRAQRRRHPSAGRGGHLPTGDLRRDAGGRGGARNVQARPRRTGRMGDMMVRSEHPTVRAAVEAAHAAGDIAMKYYRGGFEVTIKQDQTPVTQADRDAEREIIRILERTFPDYGFLGEEFGERGSTAARWIIDPIAGTKNFGRRVPFWAILIAPEEHGEVTTGVVFNPVTGELYTARKGEGAFRNGEPIHVSDCGDMKAATVLHSGLRILREQGAWDGFVRLVDASSRTRGFGDYY